MRRQTTELNWHLGLVTLIVARGPYANLSPAQKFERKLLKEGQPAAMQSFTIFVIATAKIL